MAEALPHLVLARKWRPERFAELVGQESVTRTLTQALSSGRIAHAFLFTGIRGVGKTTAARILARCLNCERGPTAEPCGECAACIEIRQGRALDVVEIDGATYRKIDDARLIIENLSYRPARDRFKIYIIDEAHQLTDQAFNALLKTFEEPPPHVKFILATTEPQKMPETILSRLQRYDFRRIPIATIRTRLDELARREATPAEAGALTLIAREAGGSMRDAERMLETAIALGSGMVKETDVSETLGVASRARVFALTEAILNKDAAEGLRIVRELHARGANLETVGRDLLEMLRNLTVAKLPDADASSPLDDLPDYEAAEIRRLRENVSIRDLMRLFRLMAQIQEEILRSPYTDLLLEMAVVRMATLAPVMDADELMRALSGADKAPTPSTGSAGGRGASDSGLDATARRMKVAGEVKADAPRKEIVEERAKDLPELRDFIRQRKAALAGFMEQGAGLVLEGDLLTMTPRSEVYVRYLADNRGTIATLASELYGRRISVVVRGQAESGRATSPPAAGGSSRQGFTPTDSDPANGAGASLTPAGSPAQKPATATNGDSNPQTQSGDTVPSAPQREQARKALYSDPVARRIFDELEGRLVDIREMRPGPAEPSAKSTNRR